MRRTVTQKIAMFRRVVQVCSEHSSSLDANPFFKAKLAAFKQKMEQVEETAELLDTSKNGLAASKKQLKLKLANTLGQVCGCLSAIANENNDPELESRADMSENYFRKLRDEELVVKANIVQTMAQAHAAALADFGWTPAALASIPARTTAFAIASPKPVANRTSAKTLRAHLYEMVRAANTFLNKTMDKAASIYKSTDPLFYSYYKNARRTYHQGLRHKQPVPGAEVEETVVLKTAGAGEPVTEPAAPSPQQRVPAPAGNRADRAAAADGGELEPVPETCKDRPAHENGPFLPAEATAHSPPKHRTGPAG